MKIWRSGIQKMDSEKYHKSSLIRCNKENILLKVYIDFRRHLDFRNIKT